MIVSKNLKDFSSSFTVCLIFIAFIPLISGCDKDNLTGNATSEIHITASVHAENEKSVHVQASLDDGRIFGTSYSLTDGDAFVACVDTTCREMNTFGLDPLLPIDSIYSTSLPYRSGMIYTVSLTRRGYDNAPDSHVILPDSFDILTPAEGSVYTDGESIPIEWFPAGVGEDVTVVNDLSCLLEDGTRVDKSGDFQSDLDQDGRVDSSIRDNLYYVRATEDSAPVDCDITITVKHSHHGQIDPIYKGGSISGMISRTVQVKYLVH
jgi:hypothetical protein